MLPGYDECPECEDGWQDCGTGTYDHGCPACSGVGSVPSDAAVEAFAKAFHENYEALASDFGYTTREESRTAWPPPNADLMRATTRAALVAYARHLSASPHEHGETE